MILGNTLMIMGCKKVVQKHWLNPDKRGGGDWCSRRLKTSLVVRAVNSCALRYQVFYVIGMKIQ